MLLARHKRGPSLACAALLASAGAAALLAVASPANAAVTCTSVMTSKGSLTAAYYDTTPLPGTTVNAMGCDIGIYYDGLSVGSPDLTGVTVENATRYGVLVDGIRGNVTVDVEGDTITDTGDHPFDGVQYGIGVYYYGYQTTGTVSGTVSGNVIDQYQKGGITVNGSKATVTVTGNTVTGLGPVDFIAQNGIQFGFGANLSPSQLSGNRVTGNIYTQGSTPPPTVATGILLYKPTLSGFGTANVHATIETSNHVHDNQANVTYVG